jgi:hypothetical protein
MRPILFITLILTTIILSSFILSSCTTAYIPTELNTPAFHEENQFRGGLSYGASGTNLHLGYSFLKHFGVTSDISYLRRFGNNPEFQRNWGFALGYFTPLEMDKAYMEVFGGFHIGETRSAFNGDNFNPDPGYGYENAKYYKLYVQPDISFPLGFVELIFAVRINYMNFTMYERYNTVNPEPPRAFGMEPAFTIRMGSEYIRLKCQIGTSLTGHLSGSSFNYNKIFMHVGLGVSF